MTLDNTESHIENDTPSANTFDPLVVHKNKEKTMFSVDTHAFNTSQHFPLSLLKKLFLIFIYFLPLFLSNKEKSMPVFAVIVFNLWRVVLISHLK